MDPDDIASLDQLCQQAVWGGYPFAGELPESMSESSDGVSAREDAITIVTRQSTLIQSIRGGKLLFIFNRSTLSNSTDNRYHSCAFFAIHLCASCSRLQVSFERDIQSTNS